MITARRPLVFLATAAIVAALLALRAAATEQGEDPGEYAAYEEARGGLLDAYIAGRLITAYSLSEHLGAYTIGVVVREGSVTLTGAVDSTVQRDLAIEIARGVQEATQVESRLRVEEGAPRKEQDADAGFASHFGDASITARVKTRLLWNDSTSGLLIDVATRHGVVTLGGSVESAVERELAGQIAVNTRGVTRVENRLAVEPPP